MTFIISKLVKNFNSLKAKLKAKMDSYEDGAVVMNEIPTTYMFENYYSPRDYFSADTSGNTTSGTSDNEIQEEPNPELISLDDIHQMEAIQEYEHDHVVETLHEQIQQLDNYNWELMHQCRETETRRRIARRSLPRKIKDRMLHWKYLVKRAKTKAKIWFKCRLDPSNESRYNYVPPYTSYRDHLTNLHYAQDMEFPNIQDPELF